MVCTRITVDIINNVYGPVCWLKHKGNMFLYVNFQSRIGKLIWSSQGNCIKKNYKRCKHELARWTVAGKQRNNQQADKNEMKYGYVCHKKQVTRHKMKIKSNNFQPFSTL